MGITMLISAIDVVLLTALATLGAFIYNMAAALLGGIEITLAEDVRLSRSLVRRSRFCSVCAA